MSERIEQMKVASDALLGVPDPCKTCSDRNQDPDDPKTNCYHCGPPAWECHDVFFADDDTPNLGLK
jgi:hypothetical protein